MIKFFFLVSICKSIGEKQFLSFSSVNKRWIISMFYHFKFVHFRILKDEFLSKLCQLQYLVVNLFSISPTYDNFSTYS